MPATVQAIILHTTQPVYSFGLEASPPHMYLHGVYDRAARQRLTVMDDNMGVAVYEGFINASITYDVDCHVRQMSGVQNEHPGRVISGAALEAIIGSDAPFRFSRNAGEYVLGEASRGRRAGEFHKVDFRILQLFPEGETFGSNLAPDIDRGQSPPVEITGPAEEGAVDPSTGAEILRVLRFTYEFTPARGHEVGEPRIGYVTRIMNRGTTPNKAAYCAYHNPPDYAWQSTQSNVDFVRSGPAWNNDDPLDESAPIPGSYRISGVYELDTNTWLYTSDLVDGVTYDSGTHGTNVIVIRTVAGATLLKIGNLPNLAAVLDLLGLADATTLTAVYEARTGAYYHGATTGADEIAFWRMTADQPVAPPYFQMWEVYGQRSPVSNFHFLRCTYTKFDPDLVSWYNFPDPPPATKFNLVTTTTSYPLESVDVIYCHSDATYDLGDAGDLAPLYIDPPTAGKHLWIFKWGSYGSYSGIWHFYRGTAATANEWWTAMGHSGAFDASHARYAVVYHANGNGGTGRYHKGSTLDGDPFTSTIGLDLY